MDKIELYWVKILAKSDFNEGEYLLGLCKKYGGIRAPISYVKDWSNAQKITYGIPPLAVINFLDELRDDVEVTTIDWACGTEYHIVSRHYWYSDCPALSDFETEIHEKFMKKRPHMIIRQ